VLAILVSVGAFSLVGCHSTPASASRAPEPLPGPTATPALPADPNEALRTELSSGLFQLSATLDSIQAALKSSKELQKVATGTLKEALAEVTDRIDSCGSTLAEHSEQPPTAELIKGNFSKYDDQRLKTIDDVNDSLAELREVKGMVKGLTGDTPELEDEITKLTALVDQAMEDATGTLQALGGKQQMPDSTPVSSPSDDAPQPS